jgi:hypothetical protein
MQDRTMLLPSNNICRNLNPDTNVYTLWKETIFDCLLGYLLQGCHSVVQSIQHVYLLFRIFACIH